MPELNDNDLLVVGRDDTSYTVEVGTVMSDLQDTDLLVVGRDDTSYSIKFEDFKSQVGGGGGPGGGGIFPSENDLTINPSVPGSGTLEDPFILQTRTAAPAGSTVFTSETITFTGQPPSTDVIWTDNSTGSGTRFSQPVTKTDANGTWSAELQYADAPDSTGDINYTGNLQIGVLHFRWQVDQKLNDRIPTQVDSVNLVDTGLENGPRFTDQSFVFTSVVTDGAPLPTKTIEAHVDGSLRVTPETSEIVGESTGTVPGGWNAAVSTPDTGSYSGITFGSNFFIAVRTGDRFMRTTDGVTWEQTGAAPSGSYLCVAYGNGRFVALSESGGINVYSDNAGANWANGGTMVAAAWRGVTFGNGKFVAVNNDSGGQRAAYSADGGSSWTSANNMPSKSWQAITYGNELYVAVGSGAAAYSTDGANWTDTSTGVPSLRRAICYADGKFVAVGDNKIQLSNNGIDWEPEITVPGAWSSVTYGNGKFVAVAYENSPLIAWSINGIDWTTAESPDPSKYYGAVTYANNVFVAVGPGGNAAWSEYGNDPYTLTELTLANDSGLSNFAAGDAVVQDSGFGPVTSEIVGVGTAVNDGSIYQGGTVTGDPISAGTNWDNIFDGALDQSSYVLIFGPSTTTTYELPVPITVKNNLKFLSYSSNGAATISIKTGDGTQLGIVNCPAGVVEVVEIQASGTFESIVLSTNGSDRGDIYYMMVDDVPYGSDLTNLTLADNKDLDKFVAGDLVQQDSPIVGTAPAFSTTLYTGENASYRVVNGIDNSGSDGLVWIKSRNGTGSTGTDSHRLIDTKRGRLNGLASNLTNAQNTTSDPFPYLDSFNNDGYTVGYNSTVAMSGINYVGWNFKVAPKFFDIQTYTGTATQQSISHNLNSVPGFILYKNITQPANWNVYHMSLGADDFLVLDENYAATDATYKFDGISPTSTTFTVGAQGGNSINTLNDEYVAYLFADEPGQIKCGSMTSDAASTLSVDCGFEPQWLLFKRATGGTGEWRILDDKRTDQQLYPNTSGNETGFPYVTFTSTGFDINWGSIGDAGAYIYVAIAKDAMADATVTPAGLFQSTDGNTITLTPQTDGWQANQGKKALGPTTTASGTVSDIDGSTISIADSEGTWTPNEGKYVVGPEKITDNARQYLKFDSSGNVTDMQSRPQDPPYTTTATNPNLTLTFPSTFPSGETPDDELPEGTTLSVGIASENVVNRSPVTGYEEAIVQPVSPVSVSDLFATTLYTGDNSNKIITNGIDLAGEGGLVWIKQRIALSSTLYDHCLSHSEDSFLRSNTSEPYTSGGVEVFNSDGFLLEWVNGNANNVVSNKYNEQYVSWCFRKAPKFFDIQVYDGDGQTQHQIPHELESVPGMMIVKKTDSSDSWHVYHQSVGNTQYARLENTDAFETRANCWANTDPTTTVFTVGADGGVNDSNFSYVAYLFADTPGLIKCGSYVGTGANLDVDCGFEPQWVMIKNTSTGSLWTNWLMYDNKRSNPLAANLSTEEGGQYLNEETINFIPNGFNLPNERTSNNSSSGSTYIYVAIAAPVVETMTAEQFTESQAKFSTYELRSDLYEGAQAKDKVEQLTKKGADPYEYFNKE